MLNVNSGVVVEVLSHADLVTCSINASARNAKKVGPSSLYRHLHPAKKIMQFRTDLGT